MGCLQLGKPLCLENRTRFFTMCYIGILGKMLRARKHRFALCFRVLSNQYVERSAYTNVFKFNREIKHCDRAKVNSRCFFLVCSRHVGVSQTGSNMAYPY